MHKFTIWLTHTTGTAKIPGDSLFGMLISNNILKHYLQLPN